MDKSSLVSVIIPCYNGEDHLKEAIESVLKQTYKNIEVVVVNDGSTDSSEDIIRSLNDKRIKYIYQNNQGLSAARNTGIRNAKGAYFSFLDDDDTFLPRKIENQIAEFNSNEEYGLIAQGFYRTNDLGDILYSSISSNRLITLDSILVSSQFHVCSSLIKREWVEEVGFFDTTIKGGGEDWDYYCRLALAGCKMYYQNIAECTYRVSTNALTYNAPRMTDNLLKVVTKSFSSPLMPQKLEYLEKKAKLQTLIIGIARCLALNYFDEGKSYLEKASKIDLARLQKFNYEELIRKIASFCKHMQVADYEEKARLISTNIETFKILEKKINFHIHLSLSMNRKKYFLKHLLLDFRNISTIIDIIRYQLINR